jgi:hypothetical protein
VTSTLYCNIVNLGPFGTILAFTVEESLWGVINVRATVNLEGSGRREEGGVSIVDVEESIADDAKKDDMAVEIRVDATVEDGVEDIVDDLADTTVEVVTDIVLDEAMVGEIGDIFGGDKVVR